MPQPPVGYLSWDYFICGSVTVICGYHLKCKTACRRFHPYFNIWGLFHLWLGNCYLWHYLKYRYAACCRCRLVRNYSNKTLICGSVIPDVSQTVHSLGIPLSQAKRRHISAVSLFSSAQQTIISHWAVARRRSKSSILSALSSANISILCPKVFSAPRRADTADRHIITAENMKITAVS